LIYGVQYNFYDNGKLIKSHLLAAISATYEDKAKAAYYGREIVEITWQPQKKGYHTIRVELVPKNPDGNTVLDGLAEKNIFIK